jgi:hypothetical protein
MAPVLPRILSAAATRHTGVVVDDDTDAGALGARAELHLGALRQGGLGECESPVEASEVSLAQLPVPDTGCDGLSQSLEAGYLLGLLPRGRQSRAFALQI